MFLALLFLLPLGVAANLRANADISATAEMSQPEINAGDTAELQIRVAGADQAEVPNEISVEGLQIRLTGQSTQVQMDNFKISSSVVYSYVVIPLHTGKFTIPGISIRSSSGTLRTSPVTLSVLNGGANGSQSQSQPAQPGMPGFSQPQVPSAQPAASPPDLDHIAFGEINCPKKSLYVGEMVPVEIRYYFDARYPVQPRSPVDLGSEGIIVERFPDPKQTLEEKNGSTYTVLTFHTLLSAVKPGPLDISPAKFKILVQLPEAAPPGFDNPFFQQIFRGRTPYSEIKELTVNTPALHLDVLPLPKEGRPASFAGAVGQFDIDAMVSNPKPAPGDPANLVVKIGGKGNFNAMGAPVLTDAEGWRSYPPADKFEGSGELSNSGVKSFDFTLIAQEEKKESPGAEFAYFDPVSARYETLTAKPLPLEASPGKVPSVDATAALATPTPSLSPTPQPKVVAVKEGDPIPTVSLRSWKTPVQRPEFLIATLSMLIATAAWAGILHFTNLQKKGGSETSRRRRRMAELLSALKSDHLDAAETYDAALDYATLIPTASEARDSVIAELSARRDVLKYGSGRSVALGREERARLLEKLENLSSSKI